MNDLTRFHLSEYVIAQVLLVGVLILLCILAVRYVWASVFAKNRYSRIFQRTAPMLEALIWIIYLEWVVQKCIHDTVYYNVAVGVMGLAVASLIYWFAVKDWIASLIFKAQGDYDIGKMIRIGDEQGSLRYLGYLSLLIEKDNGEHVRIPYSKISGNIHGTSQRDRSSNHYKFIIRIEKTLSLSKTIEQLRVAVLQSPWTSPRADPQIRLISKTEDHFVFEIIVQTIGSEFYRAIEDDVKQVFAQDK
ncbi:MAG: mechanosensitive ion channel [Bacteroidetes bacterium]|nr:mechanosensitive ion channel [Bacteroidota bacterium]